MGANSTFAQLFPYTTAVFRLTKRHRRLLLWGAFSVLAVTGLPIGTVHGVNYYHRVKAESLFQNLEEEIEIGKSDFRIRVGVGSPAGS